MLQLVKEPIATVAVCGRAGQGKSVIRNEDLYLDLSEDSGRTMPRDYLELALKPVDDRKRDVVAKK
ncbi:hypothetical protein Pyn_29034 [Prunus yedoensis var. nudiflora]|uniref:Uncharacterized protein n=1 Tax=Prunus yedoensis var. nudiflora TaxID=2094558 RepID=A0A314UG25_PRUYE|nr:hypothetical protein Pyn_29034 [Prunus yedoensis var. nudiflora]